MRGKRLWVVCAVISLFSIVALLSCLLSKEPTFKDITKGLNTNQIEHVSIYNKRKFAQLTTDDTDKVISLINKLKLEGEASHDYCMWQGVGGIQFHITLKNGIEFDYSVYPPLCIINSEIIADQQRRSGGEVFSNVGYLITNKEYLSISDDLFWLYWSLKEEYFPE